MLGSRSTYIVGGLILSLLLAIGLAIGRKRVWQSWNSLWDWVGELVPDVSRQKLVAAISIFGSVFAVVATYFWLRYYSEASAEPASQFAISIAWLVVAIIQFLIPSDAEWEMIHAKRAKYDQDVLKEALANLVEERRDFQQIVSRKGSYNHPAHKKAAEVDSFVLLLPSIQKLRLIRKFRRRADAIVKEIERNQILDKKDVIRLISLLDQLEPLLRSQIEKLERVCGGLV